MIYEEYIDVLMNNPMNYKMNIMHVKNHDLSLKPQWFQKSP